MLVNTEKLREATINLVIHLQSLTNRLTQHIKIAYILVQNINQFVMVIKGQYSQMQQKFSIVRNKL